MTNLERRALLGDKQAQEQCTRQGIVLTCPRCNGRKVRFETDIDSPMWTGGFVCSCGLRQGSDYIDYESALQDWNTRPAPPIGRCGECANARNALSELKSFCKSKAEIWTGKDPYAAGVRDALNAVCAWIDNAQAGEDHDA